MKGSTREEAIDALLKQSREEGFREDELETCRGRMKEDDDLGWRWASAFCLAVHSEEVSTVVVDCLIDAVHTSDALVKSLTGCDEVFDGSDIMSLHGLGELDSQRAPQAGPVLAQAFREADSGDEWWYLERYLRWSCKNVESVTREQLGAEGIEVVREYYDTEYRNEHIIRVMERWEFPQSAEEFEAWVVSSRPSRPR